MLVISRCLQHETLPPGRLAFHHQHNLRDPARGQAAARQLVENDNVIAIVGMSESGVPTPLAPYFEEQHVPVMSVYSTDPAWSQSPNYFALGSTSLPTTYMAVDILHNVDVTKFAVVACAEFAACTNEPPLRDRAGELGMDFSGTVTISASQTDYSAECLRLKGDDVEGAILFVGSAQALTFKSLRRRNKERL